MLNFIKSHFNSLFVVLKDYLKGFPKNSLKKVQLNSKNRVYLIDEIRGLAVIGMVVYHFFFDLVYFFNVNIPYFYSPAVRYIGLSFSVTFIFIAGISCNFSRNNLKRGIRFLAIAIAFTIFTNLTFTVPVYLFGVLHLLGSCMIIYHYSKPLFGKVSVKLGFVTSLALMHVTYNIFNGYLNFLWLDIILPRFLYKTNFLYAIGLPNVTFSSLDYFPLNPWFWCFLAGVYFGAYIKLGKLPKFFYKNKPHSKLLATLGVNSLLIYIIHQPIMYLTMLAIYYLLNFIK